MKCPLYGEHYTRFRAVNLWDTCKVLEFQDWKGVMSTPHTPL